MGANPHTMVSFANLLLKIKNVESENRKTQEIWMSPSEKSVGLTPRSKKLGMLLFPKRNTSSENLHHPKLHHGRDGSPSVKDRFLPKNYTTWPWRSRQRWQPLSQRKLLHMALTTSLG
jgi:hypothetical protein